MEQLGVSKVVADDSPKTKIWGESEPGKVFWDEVKAPENTALLDEDFRARKLDETELSQVQRKIKKIGDALAVWDYLSYPRRLKYYKHMALNAADDTAKEKWVQRYRQAKENPPQQPEQKRKGFFKRQEQPLTIESEKDAQQHRLWMDRAQKRLNEHNTAVKNQEIYDQLAREMLLEVNYFAQRIIQRWTALGYREEFYVNGKRKLKRVHFEEAFYTEDEIQYKIHVSSITLLGASHHQLPDGVTAWQLVMPSTMSELTAACERPVSSPHIDDENSIETFQNGAWVTVYREGLTDGMFDYIEYNRVITKYEPEKRDRFPVPIGVMRGRIVQWLYLDEHPHLMVNGISGSGKTNVIREAIITLAQNHNPRELRFYFTDLKRGGDFRKLSQIPHLASKVMTTTDEMEIVMPQLVALMYNRMTIFNKLAVRDIIEYNRLFSGKRMERIIVVIDECSAINDLAADKEVRDKIWRALTLISTQARAAGIHLLLGTQQSFSDAIPKSVRDNITFVLSGRQRTLAASMATFGSGKAKRLPNIRGRMWCDDGGDLFQVQTPYVTSEDEEAAIALAMQYGDFGTLELPDPEGDIELPPELAQALEDDLIIIDAAERTMPAAPAPALPSGAPIPPRRKKVFGIDDVVSIAIENFDGILSAQKIHAYKNVSSDVSRRQVGAFIESIAKMDSIEYEGADWPVKKYGKGWQIVKPESQNTETPDISEYENLSIGAD